MNELRTQSETRTSWLVRAFRRPTGTGIVHWMHSFSLHVATGFIAVAAHYALMFVMLRAGLGPVTSSAIGFAAGAATSPSRLEHSPAQAGWAAPWPSVPGPKGASDNQRIVDSSGAIR